MSTLKFKEALKEKEEEFHGKDDIFSMVLLTNPGYISSARSIMFTSHLRQLNNLVHPELPRVFTNYENIVGKYSTSYYKAKSKVKVVKKIPRFEGDLENHLYDLITYDEEKDKYGIIFKKNVEDLTEKFGYSYNNKVLDSKREGSTIKKGEVLYKSSSYDDDMNYRYGKNSTFMYALHNDTIEDAIICSESYAKSMTSTEVETIKVSLNDNDILCNIYGGNEEYKCFPDIGEQVVDKVICCKRRIHNAQLLFDLKASNLKKINYINDTLTYAGGTVTDIVIYSNQLYDDIPDNIFNKQIKDYLRMQTNYYQTIYEQCKTIIHSGSKYSADISYIYKKAKEVLDPDVKWKEEDNSVFSNMVIEFTVTSPSQLTIGQKITGRYGNKGVISEIYPDDEMPYLKNGKAVDVIFNSLGVVNRLNSFQLFELSITFICDNVAEKIRTMDDISEKEELFFEVMDIFNAKECASVKKYYKKLSANGKESFFADVIKDGMFIHVPPMWENDMPLFDKLALIYSKYDWIKPYEVYINKFGRSVKIMKPLVVGSMYVMKLKQSSKKGFSGRSTGALSKRGVPQKSNKAKNHQDLYSQTPIRVGYQENNNINIGVDPELNAKLHLFYRSSVLGRRYLGKELVSNIDGIDTLAYNKNFKNRNVEILHALFKTLGYKLEFNEDYYVIDPNVPGIRTYKDNGKMVIADKEDFEYYTERNAVIDDYNNDYCFVGTKEEYEKMIDEETEKRIGLDPILIDIKL